MSVCSGLAVAHDSCAPGALDAPVIATDTFARIATFSISPISQLTGALPRRQLRLVEAWAELHQAELLDN